MLSPAQSGLLQSTGDGCFNSMSEKLSSILCYFNAKSPMGTTHFLPALFLLTFQRSFSEGEQGFKRVSSVPRRSREGRAQPAAPALQDKLSSFQLTAPAAPPILLVKDFRSKFQIFQ